MNPQHILIGCDIIGIIITIISVFLALFHSLFKFLPFFEKLSDTYKCRWLFEYVLSLIIPILVILFCRRMTLELTEFSPYLGYFYYIIILQIMLLEFIFKPLTMKKVKQ